jgi:hypothetical protein
MRALAICLLSATAAQAGEVMVAARVGAFLPQPFSTLGPGYLVGIEAGWVPPVWKKRLALAVDLAFTAPVADGQFQSEVAAAPVTWHAAVREVGIGVSLAVRQPLGRLVPYLALGPRLLTVDALVSSHAGDARLPTAREGAVALGLSLVPGLGLQIAAGQLFVELPCAFLWRVGATPLVTGDFDPSSLAVAAGYRVFF